MYVGTGTADRVDTAMKRAAKALGVKGGEVAMRKLGYTLVYENMGSKAAARAAENYLLGKATAAGQKFTKIGGGYVKKSGDLLNKKWGTDWNRKAKDKDDWFADFWPEIMSRSGDAWKSISRWF